MMSLSSLKPSVEEESSRRLITAGLLVLTLVAALAWGVTAWRASAPAPIAPVAATALPVPVMLGAVDLGKLMGAGPAASEPSPEQRFVVLGVLAGVSGGGAALIAVDGQPPKPFGVGAEVAPGLVLKRLAPREVMLAESLTAPVKLTLPLPEWQPRAAAASADSGPVPPGTGDAPAEPNSAQPVRRADQRGP